VKRLTQKQLLALARVVAISKAKLIKSGERSDLALVFYYINALDESITRALSASERA